MTDHIANDNRENKKYNLIYIYKLMNCIFISLIYIYNNLYTVINYIRNYLKAGFKLFILRIIKIKDKLFGIKIFVGLPSLIGLRICQLFIFEKLHLNVVFE